MEDLQKNKVNKEKQTLAFQSLEYASNKMFSVHQSY